MDERRSLATGPRPVGPWLQPPMAEPEVRDRAPRDRRRARVLRATDRERRHGPHLNLPPLAIEPDDTGSSLPGGKARQRIPGEAPAQDAQRERRRPSLRRQHPAARRQPPPRGARGSGASPRYSPNRRSPSPSQIGECVQCPYPRPASAISAPEHAPASRRGSVTEYRFCNVAAVGHSATATTACGRG